MTKYDETKIRQYENFIRERLNAVVRRLNFDKLEKNGKSFLEEIKNRFYFDNENDWQNMTSCLDVIADSQLAITDFTNNRNSYKNDNYLMIYGVLSAVYIQQQALIRLSQLFKCKKIKSEFDNLIITFLRHCISAHPVNYTIDNDEVSFKIARYSLSTDGDLVIVDSLNRFKTYNIYDSIKEYEKIAEEKMEIISRRVVNILFQTSKEILSELNVELEKIKY